MLKDVPAPELCAAVRTVANGDAVVAPTATRRLLTKYAHQLPVDSERPTDPRLERLTRRELEVLVAVASGLSNSEIAESMFLSEGTVKSHLGKVLAKLELRDRVSAGDLLPTSSAWYDRPEDDCTDQPPMMTRSSR